jgi:3-hydroxybutyrate dehydrogenase
MNTQQVLRGRSAIVTGSTSGIGMAIASALAARGANILLNGFGEASAIEALRSGMADEHGVAVYFNGADLTQPDQIAKMIEFATERFGQVDILVNNAGIQHTDRIEDFPVERWDAIIALNLTAVFHTTRSVIPGMRQRGWGRIINIASVHGLVGSATKAPYIASQAWRSGSDQVSGAGKRGHRSHLQRHLSRMGAYTAGGATGQATGRARIADRRAGTSTTAGGKATVQDFRDPGTNR